MKLSSSVAAATCWFLVAGAQAQPCTSWVQSLTAGPGPRDATAVAYDSSRGKIVLFGGYCSGTWLSDTWEWDGHNWSLLASGGPSPRGLHAMAFDAARNRVVLFGGYGQSGVIGDTWSWDGETWSQVSSTGPAARFSHAMAYDAERANVVLFGGEPHSSQAGPFLADTWVWDGATWIEQPTQARGPSQRAYHGMAYDAARRNIVMFGGEPAPFGSPLGDTWTWNGSSWTLASSFGPAARTRFSMTFDPGSQEVALYGGHVSPSTYFADTWHWDGTTWTSTAPSGPLGRTHAGLAFDVGSGRLLLVGGQASGTCFGDTWTYGRNRADLNVDNAVNVADLLQLIANWGQLNCTP